MFFVNVVAYKKKTVLRIKHNKVLNLFISPSFLPYLQCTWLAVNLPCFMVFLSDIDKILPYLQCM